MNLEQKGEKMIVVARLKAKSSKEEEMEKAPGLHSSPLTEGSVSVPAI
jgi:hypothetical protein